MSKATGAEITEFYKKHWPKGFYHDDWEIEITDDNENSLLNLSKKYDLSKFGVLIPEKGEGETMEFSDAFEKWKKEQTTAVIVIEVPKEKSEFAKAQIKALGYKIV